MDLYKERSLSVEKLKSAGKRLRTHRLFQDPFTLIFAQLSEHLSDILFVLSVYDLSPVFRRKYDMIFTFPLRVC